MNEPSARETGAQVQLGARARTILKSLAETGPGKLAARAAGAARPGPTPVEPSEPPVRAAPPLHAPAPPAAVGGRVVAVGDPQRAPRPAGSPNTVVPLPRRVPPGRRPDKPDAGVPAPVARPVASRGSKGFLKISALLAIALPTALATVYFAFLAAPQYVAEARFAVRGPEESAGTGDVLGAITGLGGANGVSSDSFIVAQYVESSQLVAALQRSLDLRAIYTHQNADFLARYRPYDFDDTIEHLTTFWNSTSFVYYEPVSGIISLTVRAFTPEDALKIARETVRESETLVNKLSERAREDAISLAKQEQARAEIRLGFARKAIEEYRNRNNASDPVVLVEAQQKIVSELEGELAKQEAELAAKTAFLSAEAPTVRVMRKNVDALRSRIAVERSKIGSLEGETGRNRPLISASMAEFERLATERDFAQKAYETSTQAVEGARIRAERQSRYLATFVEPRLPEDSLYPARTQMVLLVLICSALAWAIGVLVFYGIRDHAA